MDFAETMNPTVQILNPKVSNMKQYLFFSLVFFSLMCNAQEDQLVKKAQRILNDYNDLYQPEYIDVNTDKEFYFAGERIWYALHLTNEPYSQSSLSNVAYMEIRDKRDSVIIRQKIKCKAGSGHGEILLPKQLPTGYFKLAAYTLWMKNTRNG